MQIIYIKELANLRSLIELDLEDNLIEDLEEVKEFGKCKKLKVLNVSENYVVE